MATRRTLLAAGLALPALRSASAQEVFPNRPITLVIPWAAGGSTDVMGRVIAQAMAADLGQPVVVDNRGGASGTLGHGHVARSRPDGYTFLLGTNSTYAIAPHLIRNLPYDNRAAFTGVSLVARSAQVLCVHPSVPVNSLAEFVAYAKGKPGEVTYSSAGIGASSHLAAELFQAKSGTRLLHVPYRGGGPSVQGLLAGEVAMSFVDMVTCLPFRASGQLKLLGVSTARRSAFANDIPTLAESGVPGFASSTDVIMLLPAGTPAPIVTRLSAALQKALQDPATKERLTTMAVEIIGSSPAELDTYWTEELAKWGEIIRSQNITI
ncbi:Bug family tripartite tricarboxylate transporter substrate binding protein [Falsiroseomonas tokyonensis]|uniref:Bug family tripartite tricarboxylate transporter substrate binding protein n=1 Tax=Falsiroseomonas tokyonensis TaxID=430521 RepID=A0ABV7BW79_9PROT|nr:tripartite tricarboxylate transporter substrate binding protein [Falsiroseomonas tokyonensis]MBU8539531.1 tripartite tricarboxylate transporter substrate binding protein [Falsiroseomonas tokyonensis]